MGAVPTPRGNPKSQFDFAFRILRITPCCAWYLQVNALLGDDANEHRIVRHGVNREHVEHVVFGAGFRSAQIDDSHRQGRVVIIGYTASNRCLVVFLDTPAASGTA
jgi:hypothetical protein